MGHVAQVERQRFHLFDHVVAVAEIRERLDVAADTARVGQELALEGVAAVVRGDLLEGSVAGLGDLKIRIS